MNFLSLRKKETKKRRGIKMEKVLKFNETLKTGQEIEMLLTVRTHSECRTVNETEAKV